MKALLVFVLVMTFAFADEKEVAMSYVLKDRTKAKEQNNVESLEAKAEEPPAVVVEEAVEQPRSEGDYMPVRTREKREKKIPRGASKSSVDDEMEYYRHWINR